MTKISTKMVTFGLAVLLGTTMLSYDAVASDAAAIREAVRVYNTGKAGTSGIVADPNASIDSVAGGASSASDPADLLGELVIKGFEGSTSIDAKAKSGITSILGSTLSAQDLIKEGVSPEEAEKIKGGLTGDDLAKDPSVIAQQASGTTVNCDSILKTKGAILAAQNQQAADTIDKVASVPPTDTLACSAKQQRDIANMVIKVTEKSGLPTNAFQEVLSGSQLFAKNISLNVDAAKVVSNLLDKNFTAAASSLLGGLGIGGGGGGGKSLIPESTVQCGDSLKQTTDALSCISRSLGSSSALNITAAASGDASKCLNPSILAAVTGATKDKSEVFATIKDSDAGSLANGTEIKLPSIVVPNLGKGN